MGKLQVEEEREQLVTAQSSLCQDCSEQERYTCPIKWIDVINWIAARLRLIWPPSLVCMSLVFRH